MATCPRGSRQVERRCLVRGEPMAYCVEWRLLGQSGGLLDWGCIGDLYPTYGHAAAAVSELLRTYADAVRSEDGTHWCARRSLDADIELRVWISDLSKAEVAAAWQM